MPELPDVEMRVRLLRAGALNRPIRGVEVRSPELLRETKATALESVLRGTWFEEVRRRGKFAVLEVAGPSVLYLHFGMTGGVAMLEEGHAEPEYTRMIVRFQDGGGFAYFAMRKLGMIILARRDRPPAPVARLGPEPLDLSLVEFRALIGSRRGSVKPAFLDQAFLAGIGNVYADEICFHAGIDPHRTFGSLNRQESERLYRSTQTVLRDGIESGAEWEAMREAQLIPRRRPGAECPRCGGAIRKDQLAGRSTYWCPECQA